MNRCDRCFGTLSHPGTIPGEVRCPCGRSERTAATSWATQTHGAVWPRAHRSEA